MNSKLLKIAMCLMLVGGMAGMQNGYSMEDNDYDEQQQDDYAKQQQGRPRLGMQMIQNNAYLNRIFKDKNIKGSGFSDYKEQYKFDYDINRLISLAKPSETALEQTMSAVDTAIKKVDFKLANQSLLNAQNSVKTANNSSVKMRAELTYLAGREGDYVSTLDDIDAQQAKILENINYYKQQIDHLEIQLNQIQEKSNYIDGQYQLLNNAIEQAVSFVDKYHNATVSARTRLMNLAKQVQIMKNEINDIDINEKELNMLNQTISDINLNMQNNLQEINMQNTSFKGNSMPRKEYQTSNVINEEKSELNEENKINEMSIHEYKNEDKNEIKIEQISSNNPGDTE